MTKISIERLTAGTIIHAKGGDFWTGDFAEVIAVHDMGLGEDYEIVFQIDGVSWESQVFVPKVGSVTFGGIGAPVLRPESDISATEWAEKADAISADIDRGIGKLNELQGYVCQPLSDERRAQFFEAVARALDVSAVRAAE